MYFSFKTSIWWNMGCKAFVIHVQGHTDGFGYIMVKEEKLFAV